MTTEHEIEAVARALIDHSSTGAYWLIMPEREYEKYRNKARAAIAALDAIRAQDDGWRPMPAPPKGGE